MAERVGFEPTVEFPPHSLSRRALSTAQTPLRGVCVVKLSKRLTYSQPLPASVFSAFVILAKSICACAGLDEQGLFPAFRVPCSRLPSCCWLPRVVTRIPFSPTKHSSTPPGT